MGEGSWLRLGAFPYEAMAFWSALVIFTSHAVGTLSWRPMRTAGIWPFCTATSAADLATPRIAAVLWTLIVGSSAGSGIMLTDAPMSSSGMVMISGNDCGISGIFARACDSEPGDIFLPTRRKLWADWALDTFSLRRQRIPSG